MLKLTKSEEKVMDILWEEGDLPAAEVCERLARKLGWKHNSVYSLINRCIVKGYLKKEGNWCKVIILRKKTENPEKHIDYRYFASFLGFGPATFKRKEILELAKKIYGVLTEEQLDIMKILWKGDQSFKEICKKTGMHKQDAKKNLKDLIKKSCVKKKLFGSYFAIVTEEDMKRRKEEFEDYLFNRK